MAEVNPFDIEFAEDDEKYSKPSYTGSRGGGLYKKSLKALEKERERNKIRKEYPSLTDEQADELIEMRKRNKGMLDWSEDLQRAVLTEEYKKAQPDLSDEEIAEKVDYELGGTEMDIEEEIPPAVDVPEMETEVVNLPPEDENEKEIVINRNPDDTVVNPDSTIAEGEEKPDANKKEEPKKKEEEKPVMSDEDALKEAQELAQDELLGFKISGANWEKMSEKQKAEAIKAFKDANKKEDHSTNIDKSETNNYSSYERYPTGLKVTEDALSEANTIAGGIKDVAEKVGKQGANSGSISNEVARAVPHYDYRSLFR